MIRRLALLLAAGACVQIAASEPGFAQRTTKMPKPQTVRITTKDGMVLVASYYRSTQGKDAVPVIMVHNLRGSRVDFHPLALYLQQQGFAVLVPDLRGHGESRQTRFSDRPVNVDDFNQRQYRAFLIDIEACKRYLIARNNQGELNIDKLCLVGAEFGALLSILWAHQDWQWPPLATGKQGQDVKALVLFSPKRRMYGMDCNRVLAQPVLRYTLAVYILAGAQNPEYRKEAEKIFDLIYKVRKKRLERNPQAPQVKLLLVRNVRFQGTSLIHQLKPAARQQLAARVAEFLHAQVRQRAIPWQRRSNPLEESE